MVTALVNITSQEAATQLSSQLRCQDLSNSSREKVLWVWFIQLAEVVLMVPLLRAWWVLRVAQLLHSLTRTSITEVVIKLTSSSSDSHSCRASYSQHSRLEATSITSRSSLFPLTTQSLHSSIVVKILQACSHPLATFRCSKTRMWLEQLLEQLLHPKQLLKQLGQGRIWAVEVITRIGSSQCRKKASKVVASSQSSTPKV
jgi:hypothetical protein